MPAPPAGLLKATQAAWQRYWASPVSDVADRRSDLPAISRLFQLYDERTRCYRASRKGGRLVAGSQGQPVLSTLYRLSAPSTTASVPLRTGSASRPLPVPVSA